MVVVFKADKEENVYKVLVLSYIEQRISRSGDTVGRQLTSLNKFLFQYTYEIESSFMITQFL